MPARTLAQGDRHHADTPPAREGLLDVERLPAALTRVEQFTAGAGALLLAMTAVACARIRPAFRHFEKIGPVGEYKQHTVRLDLILFGVFVGVFCLVPVAEYGIHLIRQRWRSAYTWGALLGVCAVLSVFIVHFGRWQFGGFDHNILVEIGWRQILGQRPYIDFPVTTPPGFNLGAKYAFELFGVNWDANLYFSAIFACVSFLWMYWLMTVLSLSRLAAMAAAFAIECAAMLTLCFWWYNNSVLILAAVFFLACLAYAGKPQLLAVQATYVASLTLLSLMKPNVAGVAIAGGVLVLLLVTERKGRLLLLTLAATATAVLFLLLNHVSIPAMIAQAISPSPRAAEASAPGSATTR